MRRESALGVAILAMVVLSAVGAVAVPGAIAERDPGDVRPGYASIDEVTITPGTVSSGTATLEVTSHLGHRGGRSENVTLHVRAVDLESGMVATTREVAVDPIEGDREVRVPVNVTVAREGGYRIEAVLYRDERRVGTRAVTVRGVGTLQTGGQVTFHRFGGDDGGAALPPIQYSVADAGENRTTLNVSAYLTNADDRPSGDMTLELVVRQAESNIVASRSTVEVGTVEPGETVTPGTTVTVPAGYNYYLDAILRDGGTIVDTARGAANLHPTERIDADVTVRDVGLRVEDFEGTDQPERTPGPRETVANTGGQPGFGPVVAFVALLVVATIAWRRGQ